MSISIGGSGKAPNSDGHRSSSERRALADDDDGAVDVVDVEAVVVVVAVDVEVEAESSNDGLFGHEGNAHEPFTPPRDDEKEHF